MSTRSNRGSHRNARRRWRNFTFAVLALALMTTPVSYKAGTDTTHPHAFVQFLVEAAAGTMDHHRTWSHDGHEAHEAARSGEASYVASASSGQPAFDQVTPPYERASGLAISLLLASFVVATGSLLTARRSNRLVGFVVRPPSPPPRAAVLAY
jgi:hypothetical protein